MTDKCCYNSELKEELKHLTEKLKVHRQNYQKLLIENLQKDLIIRQLKSGAKKNKFSSFENLLSKKCIDKLSIISNSQNQDSHFVAVVLSALYDENIETIKKICLSGQSKNSEAIKISSEKKNILENIFAERLKHATNVNETRKNNLNKLIRNAIDTAKRK